MAKIESRTRLKQLAATPARHISFRNPELPPPPQLLVTMPIHTSTRTMPFLFHRAESAPFSSFNPETEFWGEIF